MDEQYAAIGRAHTDLKAARQKLQALTLAAQQWGASLRDAGRALETEPFATGLNGESPMPVNMVPPGSAILFDRKIFDADKFRDLTKDIRDTKLEIEKLERTLASA